MQHELLLTVNFNQSIAIKSIMYITVHGSVFLEQMDICNTCSCIRANDWDLLIDTAVVTVISQAVLNGEHYCSAEYE